MIGPPSGDPVRARPLSPNSSPGSGAVVVAAVLTLRGPCPSPVLDDLAARVGALLAAGVRELMLDLSAVTGAEPELLRAVGGLGQVVAEAGGSLALTGRAPLGLGPALYAATLAEASWVHRGLYDLPSKPASVPESDDRGPIPTRSGTP